MDDNFKKRISSEMYVFGDTLVTYQEYLTKAAFIETQPKHQAILKEYAKRRFLALIIIGR